MCFPLYLLLIICVGRLAGRIRPENFGTYVIFRLCPAAEQLLLVASYIVYVPAELGDRCKLKLFTPSHYGTQQNAE